MAARGAAQAETDAPGKFLQWLLAEGGLKQGGGSADRRVSLSSVLVSGR